MMTLSKHETGKFEKEKQKVMYLKAKLEEISKAVLDEVIAAKPKVYHSFTLHFISSEDIRPGAEMKRCFAKATFLPEGDWQKVGRDPIDGYGNYKLDCIIVGEQR